MSWIGMSVGGLFVWEKLALSVFLLFQGSFAFHGANGRVCRLILISKPKRRNWTMRGHVGHCSAFDAALSVESVCVGRAGAKGANGTCEKNMVLVHSTKQAGTSFLQSYRVISKPSRAAMQSNEKACSYL
eukprot:187836-Pelagomonas_calceolata.AAC.1